VQLERALLSPTPCTTTYKVAVKYPLVIWLSWDSDHLYRTKFSIRPPEPESQKRPVLLGEVSGGCAARIILTQASI